MEKNILNIEDNDKTKSLLELYESYESSDLIEKEKILTSYYEEEKTLSELEEEKEKNKSKTENDKLIQDFNHETIFDDVLHKLIINSLWKDYEIINWVTKYNEKFKKTKEDTLTEENVNQILPAIRTQYIREWKKIIVSNSTFNKEKSAEMKELVEKFDKILQKQQERTQRKKTFTILFLFFAIETFLLFTILFLKWFWFLDWLDNSVLQMIIWATIWQVSIMITWIVYYLYPKTKEIN